MKVISVYELLGKVKDNEAPKKIRYRYGYLYKEFLFDGETSNYISGKDWLFGEDITAMLNDEVEIIEEDKKIENNFRYVYGCDNDKIDANFENIKMTLEDIIRVINEMREDKCNYGLEKDQ